ncbi:S8 family peptidase [Paenibacillus albidus]|uniref:S8 family peptidase n=1 Tax=Paenibacillus albidus TaxID=2041023 RepID=UPI001BE53F2A|nr:S8 family peptidase [Paenibacillus albidus]MBT2291454.1 S8 family peptidase [Paenibacillus albidus]
MGEKLWVKEYAGKMNRPLKHHIRKLYISALKPVMVPVIIQFKHKISTSRLQALQKHLTPHIFLVRYRIPMLNAVSSQISLKCLEQLCAWNEVRKIYLDVIKKSSLDIAIPSIGAAAVQKTGGLTGKGVNIAILDTGVFPHPDLTQPINRILAFKDFVNYRKRPYDDHGHGTHIAGDAAGNGWASKGKYTGTAPEAGIVGVKVLDQYGDGFDSTIIKGIEWCIAERKRLKLRILSMSFGGPADTSFEDDFFCQAVEKAVKTGLVVVISAGNSGPRPRSIESPGISPSAITVGAVDDRRTLQQGDDRMIPYSSRGPARGGKKKPDIVAPGKSIISLRAPGSLLALDLTQKRISKQYFAMSGTSVSTPIVAGAIAQLIQSRPSLSPRQIKTILKKNAFRLGMKPNTAGSGEINMRFLLRRKEH